MLFSGRGKKTWNRERGLRIGSLTPAHGRRRIVKSEPVDFERTLWAWTALLSIWLASLDTIAPPELNFEFLYVALVFLSLWSVRPSYTYFVAVTSTCLVLRAGLLSLVGHPAPWTVVVNHFLVIVIIWGAAIFFIRRQHQIAANSRLDVERENALKRNQELRELAVTLQAKNEELAATRDVAVYTLAKVGESRDLDTGRHLERICAYSLILANELRKDAAFQDIIDQEFLTNLRQSSPLHDIGKVSISDEILLKRDRLTEDEQAEMKKHTIIGGNILLDAIAHKEQATFLEMAAVIARCHHERYDGKGYPSGLSGRAIPLAARIVALADVYDALTSERPYKVAYSPEVAREMIAVESGGHFDPVVVDAFLRRFDDFVAVQLRYPNKHVQIFGLSESLLAEYCS